VTELSSRSQKFRASIAAFIAARRDEKLKGKENDAKAAAKYEYNAWMNSAAERAHNLQSVTHVLKATHPSARGSNAYAVPVGMPTRSEIGTHSLGFDFVEDTAVTDARHLDIFTFLKQQFEGRRILDWIRDDDPDLRSGLHPDPSVADKWLSAFRGLTRRDERPVSSVLAKQMYWLIGDDPADDSQYHLLQPLFASSLEQAVHVELTASLWGEPNKSARKSKWDGKPFDGVYRDYRDLAFRTLGGSNKQNVSQLNSERGGKNYLLASLPPNWKEQPFRLLHLDSSLDRFDWFEGVRSLVKELAEFLKSNPPQNMKTRIEREGIEQALGAYLPAFSEAVQAALGPGWTRNPDCKLELCERLWLDPGRLELPIRTDTHSHTKEDEDFNAEYDWGDWLNQVASRFANWINKQLRAAGLTAVGDVEYRHWARQAIIDAAWPVPLQRRAGATS
jgi:CRISPR-associated protein Csy1